MARQDSTWWYVSRDKTKLVTFRRDNLSCMTQNFVNVGTKLLTVLFVLIDPFSMNQSDLGWGAVSDLSLISDLSQKFKHELWRVKSELKLSQKQHLTWFDKIKAWPTITMNHKYYKISDSVFHAPNGLDIKRCRQVAIIDENRAAVSTQLAHPFLHYWSPFY